MATKKTPRARPRSPAPKRARRPLPGSPERPEPDRYREQYGVIVICENERHQRAVYEDLRPRGWRLRVVVT